jgi:hypothetical protein
MREEPLQQSLDANEAKVETRLVPTSLFENFWASPYGQMLFKESPLGKQNS